MKGRWFKRHASTLGLIIGVIGVPVTAWLTHRAAMKTAGKVINNNYHTKSEVIKAVWVHYIPPVLSGTLTIGSVLFAHRIDRRLIASLAGTVGMSAKALTDFKAATKELVGEEKFNDILEELANQTPKEEIEQAEVSTIGYRGSFTCDSIDIGNDGDTLFYFMPTERWFKSSMLAIVAAEYHLNRNLNIRGYSTMNELYGFLGLSAFDQADDIIGWTYDQLAEDWNQYWLDFSHTKAVTDWGEEYYIICPEAEPIYIDEEDL